ncbi:MAG: transposase domain-containing protein [Gammaproteobacteria bacterium]|nr:transposase domain-containing protein [Gammaproteobacteria bacterium]
MIQCLVITSRLHGVNPYTHLVDVLYRSADRVVGLRQ